MRPTPKLNILQDLKYVSLACGDGYRNALFLPAVLNDCRQGWLGGALRKKLNTKHSCSVWQVFPTALQKFRHFGRYSCAAPALAPGMKSRAQETRHDVTHPTEKEEREGGVLLCARMHSKCKTSVAIIIGPAGFHTWGLGNRFYSE